MNWWDAAPLAPSATPAPPLPMADGVVHLPEMVVSPEPVPAPPQGGGTGGNGQWWENAPLAPAAPAGRDLGWAPTAVARGVAGIIAMPRDIRDAVRGAVRSVSPDAAAALESQGPSLTDLIPPSRDLARSGLNALGVQEKEAETTAGRIGQTAVEFGVGSMLGTSLPSLARNATMGAVSGLASGGAGEAARGTSLETPARILGALGPPTAAAGLGALRNRAVRNSVVPALRETTPTQADAAARLMRQAEEVGSPITLPEAIQGATGQANRGLTAAQDVASNSVGGSRVMAPFLDRREAGARRAATDFVERVTPVSPEVTQAPGRLQAAAEAELAAVRAARSQTVAPFYEAAAAQALEPARLPRVQALTTKARDDLLALAQQDQSGLLAPTFRRLAESLDGPARAQAPDWDSILNASRDIRDSMRALRQAGQPALARTIGTKGENIVRHLRNNLKMVVPEFRVADAQYVRLTEDLVLPTERGLIGAMAGTDNAATQRGLLFPQSPMAGGTPVLPQDVADAVARLSGAAPTRARVGLNDMQAARDLLGAELRSRLDEAMRVTATGQPDRIGARIAARMQPTAARTDALDAAMRALPGGDQAADGFKRIMEVLGAQTFAPGANSLTARRTEAIRGMGGMTLRPREWVRDWILNANTESLARALTTPEGFHRLRAIAAIDGAARREAAIRALLSAHRVERASSE